MTWAEYLNFTWGRFVKYFWAKLTHKTLKGATIATNSINCLEANLKIIMYSLHQGRVCLVCSTFTEAIYDRVVKMGGARGRGGACSAWVCLEVLTYWWFWKQDCRKNWSVKSWNANKWKCRFCALNAHGRDDSTSVCSFTVCSLFYAFGLCLNLNLTLAKRPHLGLMKSPNAHNEHIKVCIKNWA
jgi:hypothetical protein